MLSWITAEEVIPGRVKAAIVGALRPADKYRVSDSPESLGMNRGAWAIALQRVLMSVRTVYPWLSANRSPHEPDKTLSQSFRTLSTHLIAEVMAPQESVTAALSRALQAANLCRLENFRSDLVPSTLTGNTMNAWTNTLSGTLSALLLPVQGAPADAAQTFDQTMAFVITAYTDRLHAANAT